MPHAIRKVVKLNHLQIRKHFPNLNATNFIHTSDFTDDYNCVAWATKIEDEWIQFPPYNTNGAYEDSVNSYIKYFNELGFEIIQDTQLQEGILKIAIYTNEINEFTHVARQLRDGRWASKIGDWEDIEHTTLDALSGGTYGSPKIFMQKRI